LAIAMFGVRYKLALVVRIEATNSQEFQRRDDWSRAWGRSGMNGDE